jgi:hypothetical protein
MRVKVAMGGGSGSLATLEICRQLCRDFRVTA